MFEKILFPTDFSEVSLHGIVECVPEFFKMGAKEFTVLHISDKVISPFEEEGKTGSKRKTKSKVSKNSKQIIETRIDSILNKLDLSTREKFVKIERSMKEKGINVHYKMVFGVLENAVDAVKTVATVNTPGEIAKFAENEGIDLIVIPSKGKNILREMLIGSTARNVARKSRVPLLLLKFEWNEKEGKPESNFLCKNIFSNPFIALDLSTCSDNIIDTVSKMKDQIDKTTLCHVIDYGSKKRLNENYEIAKREIEKLSKQLSQIQVEKIVEVGEASEKIINLSEKSRSTIVLIGKLGRGMLEEILVGSTANAIMRRSNLPVLLVPC